MNKYMKKILSIVAAFVMLAAFGKTVCAGTIASIDAKAGSDEITVSGTAGENVLAVAIMIYNEDGTSLINMVTTSVDNAGKYTETIAVSKGKYIVKAADYDGGDFVVANVTVGTSQSGDGEPSVSKLLGDATLDGKVDLNDAKLVLKAALGIQNLDGQAKINADANIDTKVDLNDAKFILKKALGIKISTAERKVILAAKLGL